MNENEELKISYKNYDMVIKEALTLFENKTLDFLGLDLPKIISVEDTELYKIETKNNFIDLNFMLEDGTLLHIEEETHVSLKDLLRFAQTDLMMYGKKHRKIHTVVLTKTAAEQTKNTIDAGSLIYKVDCINLTEDDWEDTYNKLKSKIESGEEFNELELIFLPLKKADEQDTTYIDQSIELAKEIKTSKVEQLRIISLMIVLMDKHLTKEKILNIWEELNMLNIMKVAQEIYEKEGMEKGIEKGKEELIWRMILKKFPDTDISIYEKIQQLDSMKLDTLSLAVMDMKKKEELDRYF